METIETNQIISSETACLDFPKRKMAPSMASDPRSICQKQDQDNYWLYYFFEKKQEPPKNAEYVKLSIFLNFA